LDIVNETVVPIEQFASNWFTEGFAGFISLAFSVGFGGTDLVANP